MNKKLIPHSSFLIFVIFCFILLLPSCVKNEPARAQIALGTVCIITLYENGYDEVYNRIFERLHEIENLMSINIQSSDISRINAAAGFEPVIVHKDTFNIIKRALYFAEISNGAFDPLIGPLVSLWGIGKEHQNVPAQEEINTVLPLINRNFVELDTQTSSVFLTHKGMELDLGAIAKGYAADEAANIAIEAGVKGGIIDLGGNVIVFGTKKDGKPWNVGIKNPQLNKSGLIGSIQVQEKTIVTSGLYERYFTKDDKHYHHIFNPSNGYPVNNELLSVTIITDLSMDADALSTAVFVLGYEAGLALLEYFPGTEAVFVFEDGNIKLTEGVSFTLLDKSYNIKQ